MANSRGFSFSFATNIVTVIAAAVAAVALARNLYLTSSLGWYAPSIECRECSAEIGDVADSSTADWTFKVRNIGNQHLVISGVTLECGCTRIADMKFPLIVRAGDDVSIVTRTDFTRLSGVVERRVFVLSNDPLHPILKLSIRANVVGEETVTR